jgi:hypothetical protein
MPAAHRPCAALAASPKGSFYLTANVPDSLPGLSRSLKRGTGHFPFAFRPFIETQSLIAVFKMDSGVRPVFFAIPFKSVHLAISISSRSEMNERPRFAIFAAIRLIPRPFDGCVLQPSLRQFFTKMAAYCFTEVPIVNLYSDLRSASTWFRTLSYNRKMLSSFSIESPIRDSLQYATIYFSARARQCGGYPMRILHRVPIAGNRNFHL